MKNLKDVVEAVAVEGDGPARPGRPDLPPGVAVDPARLWRMVRRLENGVNDAIRLDEERERDDLELLKECFDALLSVLDSSSLVPASSRSRATALLARLELRLGGGR